MQGTVLSNLDVSSLNPIVLRGKYYYYSHFKGKQLRHRDTEQVAQGHTASHWQNQDLNPSILMSAVVMTHSVLWHNNL